MLDPGSVNTYLFITVWQAEVISLDHRANRTVFRLLFPSENISGSFGLQPAQFFSRVQA